MSRTIAFVYGLVSYAAFFGTFLYMIGFVGNFLVPKSIDSAPTDPLAVSLVIDILLVGLFALQHSGMARPGFKRWLTKILPMAVERSTYVLLSSLALIVLFWQWRPIGGVVWELDNLAGQVFLYGLFASGWIIVLITTCLINHFDLFGLRQVYLHLKGKEYTPLHFVTPGPYKYIRHPLYIGWFTAIWATPTMTVAHLVFALATTVYILVAIRFEERDLVSAHGQTYASYREQVPMLVPSIMGKKAVGKTTPVPEAGDAGD
jgi:methanethiol S-methyltransferase